MSQASTVRATSSQRTKLRRRGLLSGAALALLLSAPAAIAQQYSSVGSSVVVDYGVLDTLGGEPNLPGMLATGGYPQASPYAAAPYGAAPSYGAQAPLLQPPAGTPRSTLTGQGSAGAAPGVGGGTGAITLIPPSEVKKRVAATSPAPAPTPAPEPAPEPEPAPQVAAEPTPPPPPTPVEAPAPVPVPMPEPPASAESTPPEPAPKPEPVPQVAEAEPAPPPAPPIPEPAAAPEPAPPPPPPVAAETPAPSSELVAGGALTGEDEAANDQSAAAVEAETPPAPAVVEAPAPAAAPEPAPETTATAAGSSGETAAEAPASGETATEETGAGDTQTAALPPAAMVEGQISVTFVDGASELSPTARSALDEVAERLRGDEALRVQLLAYAAAIDENTSRARRMSLSRALAVRSYLIEKGVRSTRMDVRALGSNVEGEPADRVDIIPQAQ